VRLHFVDTDGEVVEELQRAFAGVPDVTCATGDILAVAHHALVSPANTHGFTAGGLDAAYSSFFGRGIQTAFQEAIDQRVEGFLPVGSSLAIRTGHARIPLVIFAPTVHRPEHLTSQNCYLAMRAVLSLIKDEPDLAQDVFCPGLATGRVPAAESARQMFRAYEEWRSHQCELVSRQLNSLPLEELVRRGVSERLARALTSPKDYHPDLNICVRKVNWEYAVPADAKDIVPLWSSNADACVRWIRNGRHEYVRLYHDDADWYLMALSEQGVMARLWNTWCEFNEGEHQRFAEAIGFAHWELALRLWEEDYDRFEEWMTTFRG
jgi:O-acetyl-ADP-ribose deacetylase (regulator of RNase III)